MEFELLFGKYGIFFFFYASSLFAFGNLFIVFSFDFPSFLQKNYTFSLNWSLP